jgi:nucleotide-binding universal stress UspA family protein
VDDVFAAGGVGHPAPALAKQLAERLGADLQVFHADLGTADVLPEVRAATEELSADLGATAVLAPLSEAPGRPGHLLATHLDALDEALGGRDRSLAVMGSHGRGPLGAALVGSTTADFLLSSGRPAVLAGPAYEPDPAGAAPARVACCLDGSPRAETMLAEAIGWAGALDVPLWLVRAVDQAPALAAETERAYLADVAADLARRSVAAEWELVADRHPGAGLVSWLNEMPATLTVLATHGHTGLAAAALGGTAGAVVRHAEGPVVLRRPPDLAR